MSTTSEKIASLKNSSAAGSITPLVLGAILDDLVALDSSLSSSVASLRSDLNSVKGTNSASTIDTIAEVKAFLAGIPQTKTLKPYLDSVDSLLTRMSSIETQHTNTKAQVDLINDKVFVNKSSAIDTLSEVYAFLEGFPEGQKLSNLSGMLEMVNSAIMTLTNDVASASASASSANEKADALESRVSALSSGFDIPRFAGFLDSATIQPDSQMIPMVSVVSVHYVRSVQYFVAKASDGKYYSNFPDAPFFNSSKVTSGSGGQMVSKKIVRPDMLFLCESDVWTWDDSAEDLVMTGRRVFSEVTAASIMTMRVGDIVDVTQDNERVFGIVAFATASKGQTANLDTAVVRATDGVRYFQWKLVNRKVSLTGSVFATTSDLDLAGLSWDEALSDAKSELQSSINTAQTTASNAASIATSAQSTANDAAGQAEVNRSAIVQLQADSITTGQSINTLSHAIVSEAAIDQKCKDAKDGAVTVVGANLVPRIEAVEESCNFFNWWIFQNFSEPVAVCVSGSNKVVFKTCGFFVWLDGKYYYLRPTSELTVSFNTGEAGYLCLDLDLLASMSEGQVDTASVVKKVTSPSQLAGANLAPIAFYYNAVPIRLVGKFADIFA